jgi:hypothetical protein
VTSIAIFGKTLWAWRNCYIISCIGKRTHLKNMELGDRIILKWKRIRIMPNASLSVPVSLFGY